MPRTKDWRLTLDPQPVASGRPLRLFCTAAQHRYIGSIDAIVNARGGQVWRNDSDAIEQIEQRRDAHRLQDMLTHRHRIYQWNSRPAKRRLSHMLSRNED